jgi:hypothetical protein
MLIHTPAAAAALSPTPPLLAMFRFLLRWQIEWWQQSP